MELTRRDFVRICTGTVAGIGVSGMFHPFVRDVLAETLTGQRPPVFWVEGQGCTGCTVSLLNNAHPGIAKVLLEIIAMHFHPTIMAAEGQLAFQSMLDKSKEFNSQYVLIVEGSIPLKADGKYCVVGEVDHHEYTVAETTDILARSAAARRCRRDMFVLWRRSSGARAADASGERKPIFEDAGHPHPGDQRSGLPSASRLDGRDAGPPARRHEAQGHGRRRTGDHARAR